MPSLSTLFTSYFSFALDEEMVHVFSLGICPIVVAQLPRCTATGIFVMLIVVFTNCLQPLTDLSQVYRSWDRKALKQQVLDWIVIAWRKLQERPELIRPSFKVCGISNNLDGSEDKYVRCDNTLNSLTLRTLKCTRLVCFCQHLYILNSPLVPTH